MLHNLLNKIFNRDRGENKPEKRSEPSSSDSGGSYAETPPAKSAGSSSKSSAPSKGRNLDIPNRLEEGLAMKAVPENLKGKPKAWDVEIMRLDMEGIWVMRTRSDEEPFRLPAEIRKVHGTELGAPASAHTRDISMSGLALESTANFQKGEEIEIRILSWNFPLNVRAFVVRVATIDGKNTVAVTFPPDLSTISSDLISQFILENQRR